MTAIVLAPTTRVLGLVSSVALWLAGLGLVLMSAAIAYQVFMRYVMNSSPSWTDAAATMLMTWFIFLGAAVGVRERYHLGFDVLLANAGPRASRIMRTISDLVVLGFGFGMVFYGSQLIAGTWNTRIPALDLPGGMSYLPVTTGGVLICLFTLEHLLQRFGGLEGSEA
ncbi:TRAP transporter small permease [Sinorhizobium numidicum]|uniref:TRAP transporter small permease protein n=1 Tax=Sinorhizobium numidicum TaxID=680248 RepID=A0ABY8CRX1_9HYPH|nr:TRAP transporter small permease [Sinorhizobium numidicum]WEX73928.1 TRAP transporter small permease [Sinorhizobium numidicum]WEX79913.1 TRAP transporter small permease [Sinorhizobium numidicum]